MYGQHGRTCRKYIEVNNSLIKKGCGNEKIVNLVTEIQNTFKFGTEGRDFLGLKQRLQEDKKRQEQESRGDNPNGEDADGRREGRYLSEVGRTEQRESSEEDNEEIDSFDTTETTVFLEHFFRNMLLGETTPLLNREMHLDWTSEAEIQSAKTDALSVRESAQSANSALPLPPKCKNCTLEEIAVLRVIQQEPSATQKYIASEIGKSERTVKSITVHLREKGILIRRNGKRNGYWEIVKEAEQSGFASLDDVRRRLRSKAEQVIGRPKGLRLRSKAEQE